MNKILDNRYIGDLSDGFSASKKPYISHIVNVSQYLYLSTTPVTHAAFEEERFYDVSHWQRLVLMLEGLCVTSTVLVHCRLGVSRSPSLVAAYLTKLQGTTPWIALRFIQDKRPMAQPHKETWRGVMEWWGKHGH